MSLDSIGTSNALTPSGFFLFTGDIVGKEERIVVRLPADQLVLLSELVR